MAGDNYLHTMMMMVDIVFPSLGIIYHYIRYLPLEIIILHHNRVYLRHHINIIQKSDDSFYCNYGLQRKSFCDMLHERFIH